MKSKIIELVFDWNDFIKINLNGYAGLKDSYSWKKDSFFKSINNNENINYEKHFDLILEEFSYLSAEDLLVAFKCGFEHGVKSVAFVYDERC